MAILYAKRVKGAMLISIVGATVVAVLIELVDRSRGQDRRQPDRLGAQRARRSTQIVALPDLGLIGDVDVFGAFGPSFAGGFHLNLFLPLVLLVFSLLLADFFDTMGTVVAVGPQGDLLDERGQPAAPHPRS